MEEAAESDTAFRPRTVLLLCGAFLGLMVVYVHIMGWQLVVDLTPSFAMMVILELCKGAMAGLGAAILVDSLLQGKFSQLAPGHWFLLLMVASLAGQYGAQWWDNSADVQLGTTSFGMWYLIQAVTYNGLLILILTPIVLVSGEPLRWKALAWATMAFALLSLLQFPSALLDGMMMLDMISSVLMMTSTFGGFALGVAIVAMAIGEFVIDSPRAKSRDRYHWIGIFSPAALTFLMIAIGIGFGFA